MLIRNDIERISRLFKEWIRDKKIMDYKIVLLLNSRIEIHFLVDIKLDTQALFADYEAFKGLEKLITFYQIEFEEEDDKAFFAGDKLDLGLRRRLTNFIRPNKRAVQKPCPVLTFYSYKGGTGRTTTLAFFASWLATHHQKKVVILDCDFEAPGLTNYFDISEDRKGVAEYLFDAYYAQLKGETLDIKKDYAYQVKYEYVGNGSVFIVPAGNLSAQFVTDYQERSFREDYLEILARLDITSVEHIIQQFERFFKALKEQLELDYENSVILIDSRTGFNDTFAVLATLSDIIVGFFGINKQSQVGLTQFLDSFGTIDHNDKKIILVNSISENPQHGEAFKKIIDEYVSDNDSKFTDEAFGKKDFINHLFRIPRTEFLSRLGTTLETVDTKSNGSKPFNMQFQSKIRRPDSEFEDFFKGISEKIASLTEAYHEAMFPPMEHLTTEELKETVPHFKPTAAFFEEIKNNVDKMKRRERLLQTLIEEDNFPKAYADQDIPDINNFFFRDCLKDLFNRDKFIIVGYKGTGKTHIYQSFKSPEITKVLCKREKQNVNHFIFVNVIPVYYRQKDISDKRPDQTSQYFDVNAKFSKEEVEKVGADFFFERFWLAYVWSALFMTPEIKKFNIVLKQNLIAINNDNTTAEWFRTVIHDDKAIQNFEENLKLLDNKLKFLNKVILLSFDQLDFIVKPENWSIGIAPLLKYWRTNIFSKIYPKIFVRADIFENRLSNITNINELQEKAINLQWSKQELFAYFFKYIFKVAKEDFFALAYAYKEYSESTKTRLLQIEKELDSENQLPLNKEQEIQFLVEIFFGKYASRYGASGYGESYDWFYSNLTDAKNTISIRPFLDLLYKAVEMALMPEHLKTFRRLFNKKEILAAFYFTSNDAKAHAAERYYRDLSKDKGNELLRIFYQYIKDDGLEKFRIYEFTREQLDELLRQIIKFPNYRNELSLKDKSIDDFKNLLVNNGILQVTHTTNRQYTRYIIPFLYRNYFNVTNPNPKNRT
jgi:cellulose biosynthesis protein BcsQ